MRVNLFGRGQKRITTMLSRLYKSVHEDPTQFARKVHRYTHVHPEQLTYLCKKAGILNQDLKDAIRNTDAACGVCIRNGRPTPSKKVSLTHVNEAFNEEVQIDFTFITIHEHQTNNPTINTTIKYILIVIVDTGTGYTECHIVTQRNLETIISMYETLWICRHGASKRVSADDEYHRKKLTNFFSAHNVEFKPRPTRRHNKTGIVERKNAVIKNIIRRIILEKSKDSMDTIVAKATFFSNLFSGSQTLSSFELAWGYQPAILGVPATKVSPDLLNAHTEQVATRALQRVLRSRTPNQPTPGMFRKDDDIWVWYSSSKNNEPNEWIRAKVVKPHQHYIEVRRIKNCAACKGPTMKPAYEDVRIAPKGETAQTLMAQSFDEALGYAVSAERGVEDAEHDAPPPRISTMLSKPSSKKGPADDVGPYAKALDKKQADLATTLKSEKQRILDDGYANVGSQQVTRNQLGPMPPWILDQAWDKEYESNWKDAYVPVNEADVPKDANIISSHSVYKIKTDEEGERNMKSRIVPHGNRDSEKDNIRKDSSTAQLSIIRLLLSVVTFLGLRLACADIKGAYLQSGKIKRDIYVRPPPEWRNHKSYKRYTLWKLVKLPYGIVEAGRQWQKVIEHWMINEYGLERVFGLSQLFILRNKTGKVLLIIAKVTDDFLIGGRVPDIMHFIGSLETRFQVGKTVIDAKFIFNGCEIIQDAVGNIKMSMLRYLDRLRPITLSRNRRKDRTSRATEDETKQYRALAGTLLYLANGVLPQASFVVSIMQQRTAALTVEYLQDANDMLKELLSLKPWIIFRSPKNTSRITYCTLSDASHPRNRHYGQTGIISGFRIASRSSDAELFHPIDWISQKQTRVSYSSYGAEILAAAAADDRGFYYKTAFNSIFPHIGISHELVVDSHCLYDTITTLHESTEYRLRPSVQRIRNSFESKELETMRWIPGKINVADALTKRNTNLYRKLNELCTDGYFNIDLDAGEMVDSSTWC